MHFPDDGLLDVFGVVPVGRVQEDRESCRAFHERADRAFVGRAAHISPRVAYSTPSNTHLFTWPSRQSARRCDDHWNPPFAIFLGGETGGGKCAMEVGCIVLADDAQVHSFGRWIVSANRGSME